MSNNDSVVANGIASELRASKEAILQAWEERARDCVPAAETMKSHALRNSLPGFLDELADNLAEPQASLEPGYETRQLAEEHGRERSQYPEHSLTQVIDEYRVLRRVLLEILGKKRSLSDQEQEGILSAIDFAIRDAASEFVRCRQEQENESDLRLRESEEHYRIVVQGIKDHAIIRTDAAGLILDWNWGAEKIIGYSREEVVGKSGAIIFTPEDFKRGIDQIEMKVAREKGRAEDNRWHVKKDGSRFFATGIMNPLKNSRGEVTGFVKVLRDSTSVRKSQEELKQSETRYAMATRATRNAIWDWNITTDELLWNEALSTELGYPESDQKSSGQWWGRHIHPEDRERVLNRIHQHIEEKKHFWSDEYRFQMNDGTYRIFRDRGYLNFRADGEVIRMIGAMEDVSQEREAMLQLKQSGERFRSIFEYAAVGVAMTDKSLRVIQANRAYVNITGYSEEELLSKRVVDLTHPDDYPENEILIRKLLDGDIPFFVLEKRYIRKDKSVVWIRISVSLTRDSAGNITGTVALSEDVTERKSIQEELRYQSQLTRTVTDNAHSCLFLMDRENRAYYMNPAAQHVTGFSSEELSGHRIHDFLHHTKPDGSPYPIEDCTICAAFVAGRSIREHEEIFIKKNGDRFPVSYSMNPLFSNGVVSGAMLEFRDITEQQRIQEELRSAKEQAEVASASKTAFLANMSHEIRTPMSAVLGFAEVLRDPELTDQERNDALTRIENSGRALLRLIEDILDISKIEAGKFKIHPVAFSPTGVVSEVISLLRLSAEQKGIALKLKIANSVPALATSDPARIRQVLLNLVGNAIKFTEKGEVVVHLKSDDGHSLRFDVCDTGIGISERDREKLFQPFAQADESIARKFGGTGLGLMLSKRLTERMGGDLTLVESSTNIGSHFVAKVDAAPFTYETETPELDTRGATSKDFSQDKGQPLSGFSILVAEDVEDNRILVERHLRRAGASVDFASDGSEAIIRAKAGDYHLVLMDIQMPKVDGIQATRILRGEGYSRPIVALTAHAMADEVARSIEAGCDAHLTKPLTKETLIAAVQKYGRSE